MGKINVNGHWLAYDDQGAGVPVLFIHGYPLNRQMWGPQLENLTDVARVITLDLRGHGDSEIVPGPNTMERLAQDCREFLKALNIKEKVVLCGLSMGGYVSMAFYRQFPELLSGIILTATRTAADSTAAKETREKAILTVKESGSEKVVKGMLPKLLSPTNFEHNTDLVEQIRKIVSSITDQTVISDLEGLKDRSDSTELFKSIQLPVIILHGEDDQIVPLAEAKTMRDFIPNAELVVLPRAGHLTNLEQPDLFNTAVKRFLANLPK